MYLAPEDAQRWLGDSSRLMVEPEELLLAMKAHHRSGSDKNGDFRRMAVYMVTYHGTYRYVSAVLGVHATQLHDWVSGYGLPHSTHYRALVERLTNQVLMATELFRLYGHPASVALVMGVPTEQVETWLGPADMRDAASRTADWPSYADRLKLAVYGDWLAHAAAEA